MTTEPVMLGIRFILKPSSEHLVTVKQGQQVYQSFYESIVAARALAERVTGRSFNGSIEIDQTHAYGPITGESAGMLSTLILMSLLTGIPMRPDTTGSAAITPRGQLKPVLAIPEKMKAAKQAGYSRFIIAEDQDIEREVDGISLLRARTIAEAWEEVIA